MTRNLALIVCLVAFLWGPAVQALPQWVVVDLFRACAPEPRLIVCGPLQIRQGNRKLSLPSGLFEVCAQKSSLVVRGAKSKDGSRGRDASAPLFAGTSVTLDSAPRPLMLIYGGKERSYAGSITVSPDGTGNLLVKNRLPMRSYVESVVGSESIPGFAPEALKAQAVLVQTLMARYKPGDSLSDTTEKQAYLGLSYARPEIKAAVDSVYGQILTYRNLPATVYFHSTCAGGTSSGEEYFLLKRGAFPYLASVNCDFCLASPFYKQTRTAVPLSQFRQLGGSEPPRIIRRDNRGRPLAVEVNGKARNGFRFWSDIGSRFGWDKAPGTIYKVEYIDDEALLTSSGAGHGVGLCQRGAQGLAKSGKSYREILGYYFPGTAVRVVK